MIGVIGAMKVEVDNICKALTSYEIKQIAGRDFYVGNLYNLPIVVVESGIGKVNAAVTTAIMCENFDVDVIINTGVAGGVSGVKPLDLVIGKDLVYHDMDVSALGYKKGEVPHEGITFSTDEKIRNLCVDIAKENNINYKVGNIASGDLFATKKECINGLDMQITAVEMEGAAIAHTCKMFNIPFISLRVISDILESNEQAISFNKVESEAANKAVMFVCEILKKISIDK